VSSDALPVAAIWLMTPLYLQKPKANAATASHVR
jgi:hypothetical protein